MSTRRSLASSLWKLIGLPRIHSSTDEKDDQERVSSQFKYSWLMAVDGPIVATTAVKRACHDDSSINTFDRSMGCLPSNLRLCAAYAAPSELPG